MHEYMVPSYSLDILALLVVAAANTQGSRRRMMECCSALSDIDKTLFAEQTAPQCSKCKRVNELDIFDLLR